MNKLGFGFLHLPNREDGEIDLEKLNQMVDTYLAGGRTYFDTAYTYLGGKSEWALRESLVKRHPRDSFQIAAKLPGYRLRTREECRSVFEEERKRCGVEYFDVYMLHWLNEKHYRIAEQTGQFEFLKELKESGKAREIGFSYHDTADLLDEILTAHPEVDCVLIQLNYVDWDSEAIQSRRCYETVVKHGKKVLVMEPVKGGTLADPPEDARKILSTVDPEASPSSLALRFAESLPGVETVLSGMSDLRQVQENIRERKMLTPREMDAMAKAAAIINGATAVRCSGCGYCLKGCPKNICIPNYFRLYNEVSRNPGDGWKIMPAYQGLRQAHGKPSDCIGCRQCENHCPQKLRVTDYLKKLPKYLKGEIDMSKKVVVISTSLRANSNSNTLAEAFARGAKEAGNEVEFISLRGKRIDFCKGCLACQRTGSCVIQDDANEITEKVLASQVVAFATPIYYYEMSGQMKTLLDRMNSLYPKDYAFRDVYFMASAADEETATPERAINGLKGWIDCFEKAELKGSVFCGGVDRPGDAEGKAAVQQAYEMGRHVSL